MRRDWFYRIGALLAAAAFAVVWLIAPAWSEDALENRLLQSLIYRILGSLVFVFVLLYLSYRLWHKPHLGDLVVLLPALAVVVNNLPILGLFSGAVWVERTDLIWLFVLDSLLIGVFEELAFRGVLLPVLLERRRSNTRQIMLTTVISSALFGLIHLANLAEGAGIGATVLQVGYSFLIGGMCGIVLLKTGNLLWCILLHGIYDFCGGLIPTLGKGDLWDTPTVVFTAVLAVAVIAWMLYLLAHITPEEVQRLYQTGGQPNEHDPD